MRNWRKFVADCKGAAAAEFALVLTAMTLIFMLCLQFGVLFFVHNDMHNAAREAARKLASTVNAVPLDGNSLVCDSNVDYSTDPKVEGIACRHLALWSYWSDFTVTQTINADPVANSSCDEVIVEVSTPMGDVSLFNIANIFTSKTLVSSAKLRSQYDISGGSSSVCNIVIGGGGGGGGP